MEFCAVSDTENLQSGIEWFHDQVRCFVDYMYFVYFEKLRWNIWTVDKKTWVDKLENLCKNNIVLFIFQLALWNGSLWI